MSTNEDAPERPGESPAVHQYGPKTPADLPEVGPWKRARTASKDDQVYLCRIETPVHWIGDDGSENHQLIPGQHYLVYDESPGGASEWGGWPIDSADAIIEEVRVQRLSARRVAHEITFQ